MSKLSKEEVNTIVRGFEIAWKLCHTHPCNNCPMCFKPEGSISTQCIGMGAYLLNRDIIERLRKHLEEWSGDDA